MYKEKEIEQQPKLHVDGKNVNKSQIYTLQQDNGD
jgi:hypothetical protein